MIRARHFLLASLALNTLLALVLASRNWNQPSLPSAQQIASTTTAAEAPEPFHWRQLESTDYGRYVANLRAINCPEQTIRDIVRAELRPRSGGTTSPATWEEHRRLWRQLFEEELTADSTFEIRTAVEWNFLPLAKQFLLPHLLCSLEVASCSTDAAESGDEIESCNDSARVVRAARDWMLGEILTPAELAEYRLRFDPLASRLRVQLAGFRASDEEFGMIFRLTHAVEERFAFLAAGDEAGWEAKRLARENAESDIIGRLGSERGEAYLRSSDSRFRNLAGLAAGFGLPEARAIAAFQTGVAIREQWQALRSEAAVDTGEQPLTEAALQQLLAANLRVQLGEAAYACCLELGLERWFGETTR